MNSIRLVSVLLVGWTSSLVGCGSSDVSDLMNKAKESASKVAAEVSTDVQSVAKEAAASVQSAAETAGDMTGVGDTTGKATLTLDSPTEFGASYVTLLPQSPGRPTVLQIKSYKEEEPDAFPSFLVQAQVTQKTIAELVGQTVQARVFAQKEAGGPVWYTEDGKTVPVSFSMVDEKLSAKMDGITLLGTSAQQATTVTGTFECVLVE